MLGEQFEKLEQIQAWNDASRDNLDKITKHHSEATDLADRTDDAMRQARDFFAGIDGSLQRLERTGYGLEDEEMAQSALVEDYRYTKHYHLTVLN